MASRSITGGEIPPTSSNARPKNNLVTRMREEEKAKKNAYRSALLAPARPPNVSNKLCSMFDVLSKAHEVRAPKNKIAGILAFLDLGDIVRLSSTCKTLQAEITASNVRNLPLHVAKKHEIITAITTREIQLAAQRAKQRADDAARDKEAFRVKTSRQIIHAGRQMARKGYKIFFTPEGVEIEKKFNAELHRIRQMWMAKYGTRISFSLTCAFYGGFTEHF